METLREHLKSRHLDLSRYGNNIHLNEEERVATFLLFNLSGKIVGYQAYRPDASKERKNDEKGRYFNYIADEGDPNTTARKAIAVWGLESFNYRNDYLFLTEGIFNACRFHNFGYPAIALLANDPKYMRPWFATLNRTLVSVCDGDAAGNKLKKFGDLSFTCPEGKDAGDLEDKEIEKMLKKVLD